MNLGCKKPLNKSWTLLCIAVKMDPKNLIIRMHLKIQIVFILLESKISTVKSVKACRPFHSLGF